MRSILAIILHTCITLVVANGIDQNLIDRAKSTSTHDADLDATTFGKTQAATNVRPLAAMNRQFLPVTPNRQAFRGSPVAASVQENIVASRYGSGLYDLAEEKNELDTVKASVESLKLTLSEVPELQAALKDPSIPVDKKKDMLNSILDKGTVQKMCNYLVDMKRVDLLSEILTSFENKYNENSGVEDCTVKSAVKLEEDQLFGIAKMVQEKTGAKSVKVKQELDPSLIGGFILSYGGQIVDLSVRGGLDGLKSQLLEESPAR